MCKKCKVFNLPLSELFAEMENESGEDKKQSLERSKRELNVLVDDLKKVVDRMGESLQD